MARKKMTKLEQTGLTAIFIILACIVYVRKVYQPQREKFVSTREKRAKLSGEVNSLKYRLGSMDELRDTIAKRKRDLQKIRDEFATSREIIGSREALSEMLTGISRMAVRYNLKIQNFSPVDQPGGGGEDSPEWKHSFHRLIMRGHFLDFKAFLREIGYLPKLVTVEEVIVEREDENRGLKITLLLAI